MHSTMKIVQCRYFRNSLVCPFEELGCKFWHDADIQVTDANDTSEIAIKDSSIVTSNSGQNEDSLKNSVPLHLRNLDITNPMKSQLLKSSNVKIALTKHNVLIVL